MTEHANAAEAIFLAALDKETPQERAAYVEGACARDPELLRRVRELLNAHDASQGPLDAPPPGFAATVAEPAREAPGTVIGPYKLLQQIGEGGMGTVFMAEQNHPVQRKVALKLIKPGMDSRQVVARFEAERQALALMDHVNIARVLDAGATETGRPYFVMELVHGVPITKYCDDNQLTPRERLELFVPVCHAIQHAHQKGIIHRDVKPSNVMITLYDGKPVAKVIDFGVAKATEQRLTERTLFTQFGTIVGTIEYMSPEQAEMSALGVDTRSDIYSLGVLLYELLTGGTPFAVKRLRAAAFDEMLRIIREEEPPKPSVRLSDSGQALASISAQRHTEPAKLTKLVKGELDWIAMKCLEKDRNRRYQTSNGLAHDIERYLSDEPVLACPPSAGYRLTKFVRRNKGPVLAASCLLLLLIAGIVGTSVGLVRAERARHDAVEAQQEAVKAQQAEAEQRQIAQANEAKALAAAAAEKEAKDTAQAREAETAAVLDFVDRKVFAAARPLGKEGGLGREVTLRRAVETALPFVEIGFPKQPLVEARLRMTLGSSFFYLGDAAKASEQFQKSHALYTKQLGHEHTETLKSMINLANGYAALGRLAEALQLREETVALYKAELGPEHRDTLRSMNNLALSYRALGRLDEAVELLEETLAKLKANFAPEDPDVLKSMTGLANSYYALGRLADAVKLYKETLTLTEATLGPDHPDTLGTMHNLANSYRALGRFEEALKLDEKTFELRKATLGPEHPDTLMSMNNLALNYQALARHDEAVKLLEKTLALKKATLGPEHPDTLASTVNLAISYAQVGRHADAVGRYEAALPVMKHKMPGHPFTLNCMHNLAISYAALGRHDEALKLYEETLVLRKAKLGPDHPDTLMVMWGVAASLAKLDRGAEALPIVDECVRLAAGKAVDPSLIPGVLDVRLRLFAKSKDAAGCRATAEMWENQKRSDAGSLYNAACWRAVTAGVIQATDSEPVLRAKDAAAEADRAMDWLKQAVAAGFKDAAHMKLDADLDALRSRDDFMQLIAELDGETKE